MASADCPKHSWRPIHRAQISSTPHTTAKGEWPRFQTHTALPMILVQRTASPQLNTTRLTAWLRIFPLTARQVRTTRVRPSQATVQPPQTKRAKFESVVLTAWDASFKCSNRILAETWLTKLITSTTCWTTCSELIRRVTTRILPIGVPGRLFTTLFLSSLALPIPRQDRQRGLARSPIPTIATVTCSQKRTAEASL